MIYQMAPRVWNRVDEMKSKIAAQLGEAMTEQLMDCIPDTEEERITLVDKHLGSTVVDLYLLHSEANEPDHKEADSLAQALYTGMNNMIDEVLDDPHALIIANPPTYVAGFEKYYDTNGNMTWKEPEYSIFLRSPSATSFCPSLSCRMLISFVTGTDSPVRED